nr:uncharacterized protein LOC111100543 isoform X2 [Crassostrea virginica]
MKTDVIMILDTFLLYLCINQMRFGDAFTIRCNDSVQTVQRVSKCPTNLTAYETAAAKKNCSALAPTECESFQYHCVLSEDLKYLVEVCAPSFYIIGWVCAKFSSTLKSLIRVHGMNCSDSTNSCPYSYISTDAYKYCHCYSNLSDILHFTTELPQRPENVMTSHNYQIEADGRRNTYFVVFGAMAFTILIIVTCFMLTQHREERADEQIITKVHDTEDRKHVDGRKTELQDSCENRNESTFEVEAEYIDKQMTERANGQIITKVHDTEDRKHVDGRKTELQDSCENGNEGTVEVEAEYIDKQMTERANGQIITKVHDTGGRKHVDGRKTELQDSCENGNEGTVEVEAEYIDKQMTERANGQIITKVHDTGDRKHVDGRKTELQDSCENGNESTVEVEAEYIDKQMTERANGQIITKVHDTEDRKHVDGRKTELQDSCENGNESTVEVEADVHLQTNDWISKEKEKGIRKEEVIAMYQRLEDFLESEEFEDDFKKLLEKSNPNYLKILEKRRKDIERSDHGIVIAGETNAGKSTLINKILEKRIFKGRNSESTSTVCKIRNSESVKITVEHLSGQMEVIDLTDKCDSNTAEGLRILRGKLRDLTDMTLSQESKQYRSVDIGLPIPFLKGDTILVDTPGIGGAGEVFQKLMDYLPNALSFVFVINVASADGMQRNSLPKILKSLINLKIGDEMPCFDPRDVIFITNKWDTIPKEKSDSEEEDEEIKTWKNIRTEIQAKWPAVKDEYIYKMSLTEVSPMKNNKSVEQFKEFKKVLMLNIEKAENARVTQHLR